MVVFCWISYEKLGTFIHNHSMHSHLHRAQQVVFYCWNVHRLVDNHYMLFAIFDIIDSYFGIDYIKVLDRAFGMIVAGHIDHPVMPLNDEFMPPNNTCARVGV